MKTDLQSLGWSDFFEGACRQAARPDLTPARVVADHGSALRIDGPNGPGIARPPPHIPVCVGDWVLVAPVGGDERARIEVSLVRRTELVRQAAGSKATQRQTIAANIDVVFVVTDMGRDFNPRRLERYFAAVRSGGARAVCVLNKCDLAPGEEGRFLRQLDPNWPALITSAAIDQGIDDLRAHLGPGRTGGFVGSSGVGKSSLVNALLGRQELAVSHVGGDGKGRHTTTHRQLVALPADGGALIDTPGMRELALWDGDGIDAVFSDLQRLAEDCQFRDCGHVTEPGCALLVAVHQGTVDAGRLHNWLALRDQAEGHAIRKDPAARRAAARKSGRRMKQFHKVRKRLRRG